MFLPEKTNTRRHLALSILVLFFGLFLAACGQGDDGIPEGNSGAPPGASGTIRVGIQVFDQFDPLVSATPSETLVRSHIFDYLVDIDAGANVVPRLATGWRVSTDGLRYTFILPRNALFHNGSPLTSRDVIWTFDRLRAQEASTADLYAGVESIEPNGDYEVVFTLKEPDPVFLYNLADSRALIYRADSRPYDERFNGSGPFRVVDYDAGKQITLQANADYFVPGMPSLLNIEFIMYDSLESAADALREGDIDALLDVPPGIYSGLVGLDGFLAISIPTNNFDLIRLRTDRPPGNDPRVIQAMQLAVDREKLYNRVLQAGGGIGNDTPVGPMYVEAHVVNIPRQDLDKARTLLQEAGYGDGLQLTLHVPDSGSRPLLAELLKEQLAEIGITVEVVLENESEYYQTLRWMEVDFGVTGWISQPSPQYYLEYMVACDGIWNETRFCDPEIDNLISEAATALNSASRNAIYRQIQELLFERGPFIIPYFYPQFSVVRESVDGYQLKHLPGRTDFRAASLDE